MCEENRKQEERDKFEEGKKIQESLNKYKNTLETIKLQKVNHLKHLGINDKY